MTRIVCMLSSLALVSAFAFAEVPNDTYVWATFGDVDSLDPGQAYDTASGEIIENVYETLYGYKGESVTDYVPVLATSYEQSDDGLTYTYHLRDGVTFQSGNPMTCADAEYSFERLLVTNPADSATWFIAESLLGEGGNAKSTLGEDATDADYQQYWKKIQSSVECTDDMTLVFHLDHVDPAFFVKTMYTVGSIIDKKWAIANGMWDGTQDTWRDWVGVDLRQYYLQNHMSGTGAYQLVEWQPGQQVVLKAYDNYWGGAPDIKNVVVKTIDDESARILAMQQGDADRITVQRAALGQLQGSPGVKILDAAKDPELGWTNVSVDTVFMDEDISADSQFIGSGKLDGQGIPPNFFSDVNIRKCFNYSFDRQAFIDEVLQGAGNTITMALPPSYPGYDPNIPTYSLDPEAAEKACRAAWDGQVWEKGFTLTMAYNTGNNPRQAALQILKDNIEFLNPKFHVEVRGIAWPDFLQAFQTSSVPVYMLGWLPDYADPDNFITTFYASDGYFGSYYSFKDEQIDNWNNQARTETDPQVRAFLYKSIGTRAHELSPLILIPQGVPFMVISDKLQGVYRNPMYSGQFLWKDISKSGG
ncbi:MAG TPA: ABC transporter substrate-binding protein [Trueperaceae bacterium]